MKRTLGFAVVLVVLSMAVAACGGDDEDGAEGAAGEEARAVCEQRVEGTEDLNDERVEAASDLCEATTLSAEGEEATDQLARGYGQLDPSGQGAPQGPSAEQQLIEQLYRECLALAENISDPAYSDPARQSCDQLYPQIAAGQEQQQQPNQNQQQGQDPGAQSGVEPGGLAECIALAQTIPSEPDRQEAISFCEQQFGGA